MPFFHKECKDMNHTSYDELQVLFVQLLGGSIKSKEELFNSFFVQKNFKLFQKTKAFLNQESLKDSNNISQNVSSKMTILNFYSNLFELCLNNI